MMSIITKASPPIQLSFVVANPAQVVAVQANPADAGNINGGGSFVIGTSLTVTAAANSGYTFANWTENGTVQSTSSSYNFTVSTNRNLIANFTVNPVTNMVAAQANPANAGSVNGGGSFVAGSSVILTATANSGYTFANWTENGTVQSTSPSYNFTLAANRNLVANFTANPVTNTVATQIQSGQRGERQRQRLLCYRQFCDGDGDSQQRLHLH